ncbi:MAG: radical SAM protein [Treponema sp.]|jgi:sulfatase maturation enzyme AslB (radical SAM superfamily)|nr:radical SAM protein [Treponema sp.]
MDYNLPMRFVGLIYKLLPAGIIKKYQPRIMSIVSHKLHRIDREINYLDINVVDHCNLRCKYCANFCPIAGERYTDVGEYEKDCIRFAFLTEGKVKTIRLLGGEPLLHPRIVEIIDTTHKYFPLSDIDLVTNGILLTKMPEEFWGKCKECGVIIAISHYPIKLDYRKIKATAKRFGVKTAYGRKARGMYKWLLDINGSQDIAASHAHCFRANQCAVLQEGKLYACSLPPWVHYFNEYFGKELKVNEKDYIDIYAAESITDIYKFLGKPIDFCRYCNTKDMVYSNKWELSGKEITEWT